MCILRGFLETRILVLRSTQRRHLHQNGQNCGLAVEMTLRGTYGGIFAEDLLSVPRSLETRTKRGFPHSHCDYDDGTRFGRKANPARIADPVRFLHRTLFLCRPALETRYLPPAEAAQVVLPALQPSPSINWNLVRTMDESDSLESNTTPRERYESIT